MNLTLRAVSILCFLSVWILSCQKETSVDSSSAVTGLFRAKIDGKLWIANKFAAASRTHGIISLAGISFDKKIVTITLIDSGIYVYELNNSSLNVAAFVDSTGATPVSFTTNAGTNAGESGGMVEVTKIDSIKKTISGKFEYKTTNPGVNQTQAFTEGVFTDLVYSTDAVHGNTGSSAGKDTFQVKVDGVWWKPSSVIAANAGSLFSVAAVKDINNAVQLFFPSDIIPGSYVLGSSYTSYSGSYNGTSSTTGNLDIIEYTTSPKRIKAKFNFHVEDAIGSNKAELTEGYFNISYY